MKEQFRKEEHNRLDKVLKPEYRPELQQGKASEASWSGIDAEKLGYRVAMRTRELQRARGCYFIYDKWLYQHTSKLGHFALLNGKHCLADDPRLKSAFEDCREKWKSDFGKIERAIKAGSFVRLTGLPRGFHKIERLQWEMPTDLIAREISQKVPVEFSYEVARKTPEKGGKTSPVPEANFFKIHSGPGKD
jgi:hypothetical protein